MKKLFIYGFGYTAKNFVEQFYGDFSKIISSTRNKEIIKNGSNFSDLINNSNFSYEDLLNKKISLSNGT